MTSIRLLQGHEHAKPRILGCRSLQRFPVPPNVSAQMLYHIAENDYMASPVSMAWGKGSEGDKAHDVAVLGVGFAMTEKLSHHGVDVVAAAAPKSFQSGSEHIVLGGGGIEFGATFLDLADDHVGCVRGNTEQRAPITRHLMIRRPARSHGFAEPKGKYIEVGQTLLSTASILANYGKLGHGQVPVEPKERLHQRDRIVHHARSFRFVRSTLTISSAANGMHDTAISGMHSLHAIGTVFMSEESVWLWCVQS